MTDKSTAARANKNRKFAALPIIPFGHKFAVATVSGLGGVVLIADFGGRPALWYCTGEIGKAQNSVAYNDACQRAFAKLV